MSTPNVGITNNPVFVTKGDPIRVEIRPANGGGGGGSGVQSVTGDGVGGTATDVVLTFPTAGEIGAIPTSEKGAANGVATLGADGKLTYDESIVTPYEMTNGGNLQYVGFPFTLITTQSRIGNNGTSVAGCPIWVPKPFVATSVLFRVTIGEAGSQINAYLYDRPTDAEIDSTQLASLGSALTTTSGVKEIVFSPITLERGWYIIGLQCTTTGAFPALEAASTYAQPNNRIDSFVTSNALYGPNTVPPPSTHKWNLLAIGSTILMKLGGTYL